MLLGARAPTLCRELMRELRLVTYLAPGLPLELFDAVARHLGRSLGLEVSLESVESRSAPDPRPGQDPFSAGRAQLGFLCAPGYLALRAQPVPAVELVPAAWLFDDPRCAGRPIYFAELLASRSSRALSLSDLRGARWVYNDESSLSGYLSMHAALEDLGTDAARFFSSTRAVGSHHAALDALRSGHADCALIDSNTLRLAARAGRAAGLRVLASLGPYPVQPLVVSTSVDARLRTAIADALLAMHLDPVGGVALLEHSVLRFVPVHPAEYEFDRDPLGGCVATR